MTQADYGFSLPRMVWGLSLITLGVIFFLREFDGLDLIEYVWRFWPLILIAVGLAKIIQPEAKDGRGGGFTLLGIGVWMLIGSLRMFGLDYGNSWPVVLVFIGIGMVWNALADEDGNDREEASNETR
ncbi:MAG TPA: DUF5668 domain-containing protein [Thermoanaerobaculia bacterium]